MARGLDQHAAEGFVESDDREVDVLFAFGDGVFGLELGAFGVEESQEVGDAFAVAEAGDVGVAFAFAGLKLSLTRRSCCAWKLAKEFSVSSSARDGVFVRSQWLRR